VRLTLCVDCRVGKARVAVRASAYGEFVPDLSGCFRPRLRGLTAGGECADGDHAECDRSNLGEVHSAPSVWPVAASPDHLRRGFPSHEMEGLRIPRAGDGFPPAHT